MSSASFVQGVASDDEVRDAEWWSEIENVDRLLARGKWEKAHRRSASLADELTSNAWIEPNVDRLLAAVALQQAVADANLGHRREAVWHWYVALNLHPKLSQRDLSKLGKAAELSRHQLRRVGDLPPPYEPLDEEEKARLRPAIAPQVAGPPDLATSSAHLLSRLPDVHIEAVVDKLGSIGSPVIASSDTPPVLVYLALEWLATVPSAAPARLEDRPVDSLALLVVSFRLERGKGEIMPWEPPQ